MREDTLSGRKSDAVLLCERVSYSKETYEEKSVRASACVFGAINALQLEQ